MRLDTPSHEPPDLCFIDHQHRHDNETTRHRLTPAHIVAYEYLAYPHINHLQPNITADPSRKSAVFKPWRLLLVELFYIHQAWRLSPNSCKPNGPNYYKRRFS